MDLIDLAAAAKPSSKKMAESEIADPIVTAKKFGSKRKLYPFETEALAGYRMPGSDRKNLQIVCGIVEGFDNGRLSVRNNGQTTSFFSPENLDKKLIDTGIRVTGVVSEDECLDLKLGPFFGVVTWKLFYLDNKKSVTAFSIR